MVRGLYLLRLLTLLKGWSLSRVKTTLETREPGKGGERWLRPTSAPSNKQPREDLTTPIPDFDQHLNVTPPPLVVSRISVCILRRHEAAYKLTGNAEAVAKFACRGAGRGSGWNLLPGRAPLSDPNASPNMEILPDVDYCLRRVRLVPCVYVNFICVF